MFGLSLLSLIPGGGILSTVLGAVGFVFKKVLESVLALFGNPTSWIAVLILVGGAYVWGDHKGEIREYARWVRVQAELKARTDRQYRESADKIREAAKLEADKLETENEALKASLKETTDAIASQGNRCPIPADLLKRLRSIR